MADVFFWVLVPTLLTVALAQVFLVSAAEETIEAQIAQGEEAPAGELQRARIGFLVIALGFLVIAVVAGFSAASVTTLLPRLFLIAFGVVVPGGAVIFAGVGIIFTRWLLVGPAADRQAHQGGRP